MALFIIHEGKTDTPETGVLFINEFLASNQNNKVDPDYGQYVDWIEIFNSGSENIDMEGWYLTDDINDPFKWQIPDNTIIQSHDHLLIWADGMDQSATAQHSNFKLSAQGEIIGLYNPEGALIDALEYGQQHSDISYGRQPDGNSTWYFFANPTPGESNTSSGVLNATLSPDPVFSIQSGFYDGNQDLFLSVSDQEAHIYYTLDGSIPTDTSIPYSVPISLASTTIVRSRTIQPGLLPSRIGSNT